MNATLTIEQVPELKCEFSNLADRICRSKAIAFIGLEFAIKSVQEDFCTHLKDSSNPLLSLSIMGCLHFTTNVLILFVPDET